MLADLYKETLLPGDLNLEELERLVADNEPYRFVTAANETRWRADVEERFGAVKPFRVRMRTRESMLIEWVAHGLHFKCCIDGVEIDWTTIIASPHTPLERG